MFRTKNICAWARFSSDIFAALHIIKIMTVTLLWLPYVTQHPKTQNRYVTGFGTEIHESTIPVVSNISSVVEAACMGHLTCGMWQPNIQIRWSGQAWHCNFRYIDTNYTTTFGVVTLFVTPDIMQRLETKNRYVWPELVLIFPVHRKQYAFFDCCSVVGD